MLRTFCGGKTLERYSPVALPSVSAISSEVPRAITLILTY